jgi:hypothetical protein
MLEAKGEATATSEQVEEPDLLHVLASLGVSVTANMKLHRCDIARGQI